MINVIDIFAGPGGLSEGFTSYINLKGENIFNIVMSIEKEHYAFETLKLRTFFREFAGKPPKEYYDFIRGEISINELFNLFPKEAENASKKVWMVGLGPSGASVSEIRKKVLPTLGNDSTTVLIGGPPCQAYSLVGRSRNSGNKNYNPENDERQRLYVEYLQFLADYTPAVFVMENVKGIISAKLGEKEIFRLILNDLQYPSIALEKEGRDLLVHPNAEYRIFSLKTGLLLNENNMRDAVIRAENYGVPQTRHRVFLLGIRSDLPVTSIIPLKKTKTVPISSVISDLPPIRSGLSEKPDSDIAWKDIFHSQLKSNWIAGNSDKNYRESLHSNMKEYLCKINPPKLGKGGEFISASVGTEYNSSWYNDKNLSGVCNHISRNHLDADLFRYFFAACYAEIYETSPKLKDFPKDLLPNHASVGEALTGNGNFSDRFRVQISNLPGKTVVSHISKDGHYFIHPDPMQCRSLTVREVARIQTFPDNYFFCGPRTAQYVQVGNAVPPFLAKQIAEIIDDIFNQAVKGAINIKI